MRIFGDEKKRPVRSRREAKNLTGRQPRVDLRARRQHYYTSRFLGGQINRVSPRFPICFRRRQSTQVAPAPSRFAHTIRCVRLLAHRRSLQDKWANWEFSFSWFGGMVPLRVTYEPSGHADIGSAVPCAKFPLRQILKKVWRRGSVALIHYPPNCCVAGPSPLRQLFHRGGFWSDRATRVVLSMTLSPPCFLGRDT
jgi:hypothetical protein